MNRASDETRHDLIEQLARVNRLHALREGAPVLHARLLDLASWQSARLHSTYADLHAIARYAAASEFFFDDLYGGKDFSRRDGDLDRVYPMMAKILPGGVLNTIARAMELNALSIELDIALLERMPPGGALSVRTYCEAYRRDPDIGQRRHQISLIGIVGRDLDRYVTTPFIGSALKMMRLPARAAGFGALHDFLDRGFAAFRAMHGAGEFLDTVVSREMRILEAIVAGDDAPFADPRAPRAPSSPAGAADPTRW